MKNCGAVPTKVTICRIVSRYLAHLSKLIKGWIKYDGASTKAGENYEREQPHARRFVARNGRESDCLPPYISYRWKSEIRLIS